MFVAAIAAGATSLGVDVHQVGVVPTPALAFLAGRGSFAGGIMVSASHNPAEDNGLKVLDGRGLKLDDAVEDELEQLIWQADELVGVGNAGLGRVVDARARVERISGAPDRSCEGHPGAAACASSSTGRTDPAQRSARRSWRQRAPTSRSSIRIRTGSTSTSVAGRRTRHPWPRRSCGPGPTSASPSTAMPIG